MANGLPSFDPARPLLQSVVRGLLSHYVLELLSDGSGLHGAEIMDRIHLMTGSRWKPSPGSVYPMLRKLEGQGLIRGGWRRTRAAPKRVYRLSKKGRVLLPALRRAIQGDLLMARQLIELHLAALQGTAHA